MSHDYNLGFNIIECDVLNQLRDKIIRNLNWLKVADVMVITNLEFSHCNVSIIYHCFLMTKKV